MSNLVELDIQPRVLVTDNQYFLVSIEEFNISFYNMQNYLPYEMHDLKSLYQQHSEYPIFPWQSLNQDEFDITEQPPFQKYLHYTDTEKMRSLKRNSFDKLPKSAPFCLGKALLSYSKTKVSIFAQSLFSFLQSLFIMQENLIAYFKKAPPLKGLPFFSPFTTPCCTLAGFNYTIFRYFGLQHTIYAIKHEFGVSNYNCSKGELEFVLYYTDKFGEDQCYSPYTPKGVLRFKNYSIPDIATDNWAGWYMGCNVHGHLDENCSINPIANINTKNRYGETYGDLNAHFGEKMSRIRNDFPHIMIHIMWECQWNILRKADKEAIGRDEEISNFVKNVMKKRPKHRMVVRDVVKGGISECYSHYFDSKAAKNETMRVEDAVSCYPTEMLKQFFPVGKPKLIVGEALKSSLQCRDGQYYFDNQKCWGVVQVEYEVPKNVRSPFLVYQHKLSSGRYSNSLGNCYKCSQLQTDRKCTHSRENRSYTQTLTLADCTYITELGYTIVTYFEALLYFESAKIFENYLKFTSRHKICHSSLPENMNKEEFCFKVNKEMGFTGPLKISPELLNANKQMKFIYKTMENSLFGKFAQAAKLNVTQLVNGQTELKSYFNSKNGIDNYDILTENIAQVFYTKKASKISLTTNCLISGYILSYAKITMHRRIEQINRVGKVFHYSTDQLIYSWPKNIPFLFDNIEIYGYLRNVYSKHTILGFCALSPYHYTLLLENHESGKVETIVKYRGVNVSTVISKPFFNFENICRQLKQSLNGVLEISDKIPQYKRKSKKYFNESLKKEFVFVTLNNEIRSRRILVKNTLNCDTVPFGYQ